MPENQVPIDEVAVQRELDELAGGGAPGASSPAPGDPSEPAPQAPPMDWTLASAAIVKVLDRVVWPNWHVDAIENALLQENIKITLSAFFPTVQIDPRVQAVIALGGTVAMIAGRRVDLETRKIRPLRAPPVEDDGQQPLQFGRAANDDSAPS